MNNIFVINIIIIILNFSSHLDYSIKKSASSLVCAAIAPLNIPYQQIQFSNWTLKQKTKTYKKISIHIV